VAREDRDGRIKVEAGAGMATVGARGEIFVSFMINEILWRWDDDEGTGAVGTPVENQCQVSTPLRTLEILTMAFGAREHDEPLIHIMEEIFIDSRSRALAEWYMQDRH